MSNTLYTYSNKLFRELREHILSKENQLFSFSYLESFNPDGDSIYFIDITSLTTTLLLPNQSTYNAEKFFDNLTIDYKLIIDERKAEEALELFKFHISEIEKLEAFSQENEDDIKKDEISKRKLIVDLNEKETRECLDFLNTYLIGHNIFKNRIEEEIKNFQIFHKLNEHNILSLFIMGKSGVGKTEVGRLLHKYLDPEGKLIKINFGNYSSKDSLNTLIGSPRGYIGSDTGELTEKLSKSSSGIILIDEFEKANEKVFHFFLELLEDGIFTDTQGVEYNLNGYVILFTSNLNESKFDEYIFPEFKSRLNYICDFEPLSATEKNSFVLKRFNEFVYNYNEVFEKELSPITTLSEININVDDFTNIRNLNIEVRKKFVEYCN